MGNLCRISDLYDPKEAIFETCFAGDDSKFPHPSVDIDLLRKMGFNWILTKQLFKICVQHIDNEYKTRGEFIDLYQRAMDVWNGFNNRINQFKPPWTAVEIQKLLDYCFVPISRYVSNLRSYRDDLRRKSNESLITMKDVMETINIPPLRTQKHRSQSPPALELTKLFNFAPTVPDV